MGSRWLLPSCSCGPYFRSRDLTFHLLPLLSPPFSSSLIINPGRSGHALTHSSCLPHFILRLAEFFSLVPKYIAVQSCYGNHDASSRSRRTSGSRGRFAGTSNTRKASSKYILDQNTATGRVPLKPDSNTLGHILLHRPESVCSLMTICCVHFTPADSRGY